MNDTNTANLEFKVYVGQFVDETSDQRKDESQKREERIFRLKLDENGSPKKIGDGSFGAVFEVEGTDEKPYALKILHHVSLL